MTITQRFKRFRRLNPDLWHTLLFGALVLLTIVAVVHGEAIDKFLYNIARLILK